MTTTTDVAARIVAALGEALRRRGGEQLEDLVDGLAAPMADSDRRIAPTARGWAGAFDLDTTPDPKWIGTAIGSSIPGGLTVEEQREYIRARAYWRRGTPEAIRGAVRSLLTATRRVDLVERNGSPWKLRIRIFAAEHPASAEGDQATALAEVVAAARTQVPVGIVVDAAVLAGASYDHLLEEHGTYDQVLADFPVYDGPAVDPTVLINHVPEEGTVS